MNARNEPLHDMACLVKCETPPDAGGNFVVSTRKNDTRFGNKFDWVAGVSLKYIRQKMFGILFLRLMKMSISMIMM